MASCQARVNKRIQWMLLWDDKKAASKLGGRRQVQTEHTEGAEGATIPGMGNTMDTMARWEIQAINLFGGGLQ